MPWIHLRWLKYLIDLHNVNVVSICGDEIEKGSGIRYTKALS